MIKMISALLAMLLICCGATAEQTVPEELPEGWIYAGYTYGGLSFAIPDDCVMIDPTPQEASSGYIFYLVNEDCTLQLRKFEPWEMTYEDFREFMLNEPAVEAAVRMCGETEILSYRMLEPSEYSELFSIITVGTDGTLYKLTVFTGMEGDFSETAPVWEIAETIESSFCFVDYSAWDMQVIEEE